MKICSTCKRQLNEGNSPNESECNGRETDEDEIICDAYAKIADLKNVIRDLVGTLGICWNQLQDQQAMADDSSFDLYQRTIDAGKEILSRD